MSGTLVLDAVTREYAANAGFWGRKTSFRAVDGVSLSVAPGETLGIVGESGSGKSTLGRLAAGIEAVSSGKVLFDGQPYAPVGSRDWRRQRRLVQVIFQNPSGVIDPRLAIGRQIDEALATHEALDRHARDRRVADMLDLVGLGSLGDRYPTQLSGGQLQRAVIARALIMRPEMVICDEAVSALDVSVQAQIINLLMDLREKLGLTMLFISHDLGVIRHISRKVAVMHRGKVVESGDVETLYSNPRHDYTRALLAAIPVGSPAERRKRDTAQRTAAPVAQASSLVQA
ncbi:MAG: ATPase component of various ABC-type transport system [Rhizobium sp.]|jgi:ABC-type oligopeptide transport system ATPase subunit|nr:ATPase component of various ABC-type transport system [Rhizobium sp.]